MRFKLRDTQMEFNQAKRVIESLAAHGRAGCGIITLANQTDVTQSQLREFLNSNKDFFSQLDNESQYTINVFGKYQGSVEAMLESLRKRDKAARALILLLMIIGVFFLGYLLGSE